MRKLIIIIVFCFNTCCVLSQSGGVLDSSFNSNGFFVDTACGVSFGKSPLLLQPDGKILTAGYKNADFTVVRYMSDGTRDLTFNGNGIMAIPNTYNALALALQTDNKILVAGADYAGGDIISVWPD